MNKRTLPPDGSTSLDTLAASIRELQEPPLIVTASTLRSVLVRGRDGSWGRLVTVLQCRHDPDDWHGRADKLESGPVQLVATSLPKETFASETSLRGALSQHDHIDVTGIDSAPQIWGINRWPGRMHLGSIPCWAAELSPSVIDRAVDIPGGPFVLTAGRGVFEDVWELARWWCGDASLSSSGVGARRIVVQDPRAFFAEIKSVDDGVEINVSAIANATLCVAVIGEDAYGNRFRLTEQASDSRARVTFDRPPRSFRLYLCDDAGHSYDVHREPNYASLPGESLIHAGSGVRSAACAALVDAIMSGEDLHVEYKEWLPAVRGDGKSDDLFRTVVAMANAEGGTVFVGVNDYGDVVGVDNSVEQFARTDDPVAMDKYRHEYVDELRKRVLAEIRPRLLLGFEWIRSSGVWVLRIDVPQRAGGPHFVEASGGCYLRRGSTNRVASPPEIARMMRTSESPLR